MGVQQVIKINVNAPSAEHARRATLQQMGIDNLGGEITKVELSATQLPDAQVALYFPDEETWTWEVTVERHTVAK